MTGTDVRGTIVTGLGVAVHTVALQAPLLRPFLPEIDTFFWGTINLRLERPLVILEPDVRTPPLVWLSSVPPEVFSLVRVRLTLARPGAGAVDACLYQAHLSPHLADPFIAEVLAPPLDLAGVREATISLPARTRETPFLVI